MDFSMGNKDCCILEVNKTVIEPTNFVHFSL